jgi:gas vesicle protein
MKEATMKQSKAGGATFVIGLTLGSLLTALFTPKSGRDTRKEIKHGIEKAKSNMTEKASKVSDKVKQKTDETADKMKQRANQMSNKTDETINRYEEDY